KRNQLQQYRSIEAFAMVITKNKCFDVLKSKRYKAMDRLSADLSVNHLSPYSYTENADSVDHVVTLINKLPELQKVIIHLRDVEGYDFDEIAGITELSLNAVRVNLSRARKNVREGLIKVNKYELYEN
ncbi:MAG: sigma-70 family RNA polymerase sigma factor, partial [Bacteroidales bacterium]|nr:sigma-70 family RNA polymerase sigma factor [Bacteroidales bacterium]